MKKIWKYEITEPDQTIEMPLGAQTLEVTASGGHAYLWAIIDADAPLVHRRFRLHSTGEAFDEVHERLVGSYRLDAFGIAGMVEIVWHVFEVGNV